MTTTKPTGEQLRFRSSKTGDHDLDAYLESAERGTRTLADLLGDLFEADGAIRPDLIELRINDATSQLQYRFGDYVDPNLGWQPVTDGFIFRPRGAYASGVNYDRLDVVTHNNSSLLCLTKHLSTTPAPSANFGLIFSADVAINNAVRHDLVQSLDSTSQSRARSNIGAAPLASPTFTGTVTAPTLNVTGNSTLNTLSTSGAATVGGATNLNGAANANAGLTVSGGNLDVSRSGLDSAWARLRSAAATMRMLTFETLTSIRWNIGADNTAETGANAGSNFFINRHDDSGNVIETVLGINRATGAVIIGPTGFSARLAVSGAMRVDGSGSSYARIGGGNVDGASIQLFRAGLSTQQAAIGQFQGALFIKNLDSGPIHFTTTTGDITRMTLAATGHLGIGRQPGGGRMLDVEDSAVSTGYQELFSFLKWNSAAAATSTRIMAAQMAANQIGIEVANHANTKGILSLQPYGGTVHIPALTRLGLGLTNPGFPLHVSAANGTTALFAGGSFALRINNDTTQSEIAATDPTGVGSFGPLNIAASELRITNNAHTRPGANNAQDLGTTSFRWRNILSVSANLSGTLTAAAVDLSGQLTAATINTTGAADIGGALRTFGNLELAGIARITGNAGTTRGLWMYSGAVATANQRWLVHTNSAAESGGNAGSDFLINRYSDAGALLGTPLSINRFSGVTTITSLAATDVNATNLVSSTANISGAADVGGTLRALGTLDVASTARITGNAGTGRNLWFYSGSVAVANQRWLFQVTSAAESGGNAGSNLVIGRYDDAGNNLGNALSITRATGNISTIADLTVGGTIRAYGGGTGSICLVTGDVGPGLSLAGTIFQVNTNNSLGVGALILGSPNSSVNDGDTIAGSSLARCTLIDTGGFFRGPTLTGTWRNVTGAQVAGTTRAGLFIRTA